MNEKKKSIFFWTSNGGLSGIPLGVGLSALGSATPIERWHWLGFGLILGSISGLGAYLWLHLQSHRQRGVVIPNRLSTD